MNENPLLPESPEMERFVLGAMLTADAQPIPLPVLLGTLTESDFTTADHRRIFATAQDLAMKGRHVDRSTVCHELLKLPKGQQVMPSIILSLTDGLPHIYNLAAYVEILREKTRLRAILVALHEAEARAFQCEESATILADLAHMGEKISASISTKSELKEPEEIMNEIGGPNELLTPTRQMGISTPIPWLNYKLNGLVPKTFTVLGARPSVGKSALALQFAWHAAERNKRTVMYSLEMSNQSLLQRIVGQRGRVNTHRMSLGQADFDERSRAMNALSEIAEFRDHLLMSERSNGTIPEIVQKLQDLRMKRKPADLLIVDYLGLMTPVGRFQNRNDEISSISRGLKLIAQTFDIPVIGVSQLSRESEKQNREPRLSDLRDSGSVEQDADNVIFLHRRGESEQNPQEVRLILAKNRSGAIGKCELLFFKQYVRFDEAEPERDAA